MERREMSTIAIVATFATVFVVLHGGCDDEQETCHDECTADDTRCSGALIQVCGEGTGGCLTWRVSHDCGDESGICVDVGDTVGCEPQCTEECESGTMTCWDDVVMICQFSGDTGCNSWFVAEDCTEGGGVCEVSGTSASCT